MTLVLAGEKIGTLAIILKLQTISQSSMVNRQS